MPSTVPDGTGANASGIVLGIPVVHVFSARRDRAVEHFCRPPVAARRCVQLVICTRRRYCNYIVG